LFQFFSSLTESVLKEIIMRSSLTVRLVFKLLKIKEVLEMTSLSRSAHFLKLDKNSEYYDPTYPRPVKTGARSVGYVEQEVVDWVKARMDER